MPTNKYRIEFELEITDNKPVITNTTVIELKPSNTEATITAKVILRDSNTRYGYIRFKHETDFGEYIKDYRDIEIQYKDMILSSHCHREVFGRVDGLSKLFRKYPDDLKAGDTLWATLYYEKTPMLLKLEHLPK